MIKLVKNKFNNIKNKFLYIFINIKEKLLLF